MKLTISKYKRNEIISYGMVISGFIVMTILSKAGIMSSSLQGQLVPISVYIIMAISLNLVVGISGELSLGHAGFMSVGAFSGVVVATYFQNLITSDVLRLIISLGAGGLVAGAAGFLIGIPVLRLRGDYLAIVTLAFGEIIRNIMNVLYVGMDSTGLKIAVKAEGITLGDGGKMILNGPMGATATAKIASFPAAFLLVLFTLFIVQNIINSKQGRSIMAVRDNRIAAESIGLNVMRYKLTAFVISAALAGTGGVMFGLNYSTLAPSKFGFNTSVLILVFVVLGGIGNIWGGMLAATVLTVLPEALRQFSDYRMMVYAVVLIAVMIGTYNPVLKGYSSKYFSKLIPKKKKPIKEAA